MNRLCGSLLTVLSVALLAGCSGYRQAALPPAAKDPSVVAVVGDEVITLDVFEDRYARSVGSRDAAASDSLGAYRDFLDRYVNFRLKVLAATDAGMLSSPDVADEISTYRKNLARPYLLEQEVMEPIVRDLYEKQKVMNDVSHILLRVAPDAAPEDTLRAWERMQAIVDSVNAGADFGSLAFRHSEDPSARQRSGGAGYEGRLGFFSAGRMVEAFETMAYATPVGEVSPVFRTQFGYHVLYVHDRRPSVPDVQVAHIMLSPGPNPADSLAAREQAKELQERIASGEDFAALARQYSMDRGSAGNGGDLGFIGFDAPIVAPFKDAAFALENAGDVSDIVETRFGLHIIKLLERKEPRSLEDSYSELKQVASKMPRAREAERALALRVLEERGATIDTAAVVARFEGMTADSAYLAIMEGRLDGDATTMMVLGDSVYTFADLVAHARTVQTRPGADVETLAENIIDPFVTQKAIDYEAMTLEQRDEEFARIMAEFRDGLVLFKLMEDSVWTAAERDSAALVTYYEAHRSQYNFPDRTRILGFHSSADSVLHALAGRLQSGVPLSQLVAEITADTASVVRVDTMLLSGLTNSIYDRALELEPGAYAGPLANRGRHVLLVNDGVVPAGPKRFREARTEVVSAYQQVLEDRLIERLRRRYNAHIFPERLSGAFGQSQATANAAEANAAGAQ